jgi:hypothetical protein
MVKIQVDLSPEENKKVEVYKATKGIRKKTDAIKQLIAEDKEGIVIDLDNKEIAGVCKAKNFKEQMDKLKEKDEEGYY